MLRSFSLAIAAAPAEALIPTRSYVALVETLLENNVHIHALLPGTGDGVGKLAYDKRPCTYRVHSWLPVPPLFRYFRDVLGLPLLDCLKTFNWGVGYYIFVAKQDVDAVIKLGKKAGGYRSSCGGRLTDTSCWWKPDSTTFAHR